MTRSTISPRRLARASLVALAVVLCAGVVTADKTKDSNQIREVKVSQTAGKTTITVVGTKKPTYTAFKLSSPQRLVIDLANSRVKGVPSIVDATTALVDGVAVSEFSSGGVSVARVMVNFRKDAAYRVKVKGNQLLISMNGGPAPVQVTGKASTGADEAALKTAKAEAKQAREQLAEVNEKLARAQAMISSRKADAEKAEREADKARAELAKARSLEGKIASKADKALIDARKKAEAKVAALEAEIASSNARAKKEAKQRKKLEKRLAVLEREVEKAKADKAHAISSRKLARSEAASLEQNVEDSNLVARKARKEAKDAMAAQREASLAYKQAADNEKEKYLRILKRRERETVEANQRLTVAEDARRATEKKLTKAIARAKKAEAAAKRAVTAQERAEQRAQKSLAKALKRRDAAEAAAKTAIARAAQAGVEKEAALAKADVYEEQAKADEAEAKTKAAKRIAAAQQAIEKAEKARASAQKKAKELQTKLERLGEGADSAQQKLASAEQELQELRDKAAKADKRARMATKKLEKANGVIARQAKTVKDVDAKLAEASDTIEDQKRKISQLSKVQTAEQKRRMTQEEKRLARLAQMRGWDKAAIKEDVGAKAPMSSESKSADAAVTDIRFINKGSLQTVLITTNQKLEVNKTKRGKKKASLVVSSAHIAPMMERTLDVTDFGGAVERISSFKVGENVKLEVELGAEAKDSLRRVGNTIEWTFAGKGRKAVETNGGPLGTKSRTVATEDTGAYEFPMDRTAAYSVKLNKLSKKKRRYSGRRIDLDFKDADIHNILRLLSDVGHVNIVTADDVSGTVTIRMRNVPWDQALDVILQAKKLGMIKDGNLIRVAPMETLEKEREMEIARRKQSKALEPLETRLIPISYARASELSPRAQYLLSDRGQLSVDDRTNVIIARDIASNLDQVESLIRNLDTQTPQVLIEGRIVEASSTYAREIGIQWGGDFSASSATANPTGLAFPSTVGVAGGATDSQTPVGGMTPVAGGQSNPNFAVNLPAATGTGSGGALGITLGSIANNANLNLRLSAMEEEGTLRILSSPKILTLDNREAHIEQGTLIPYSRVSAQGIQTAFKEAKLNLTVTPHVTADGSVLLKMKMTRDEPDFNNTGARGDPTILKREAETELLVSDGHTAVIGGIFTRNHGTSYKKVPFFGDIPILGWLFKNRSDSDRRSEMLIFITPRIVNRAESIGT